MPHFTALIFWCPTKGKHFTVGMEDIAVPTDESWGVRVNCFCGTKHIISIFGNEVYKK